VHLEENLSGQPRPGLDIGGLAPVLRIGTDHVTAVEMRVPRDLGFPAPSARAGEKCSYPLRRIVVWDEENQREIVPLTNHLDSGASPT
jgi:hypothetical protein